MFDRFTDRARVVMALARKEAQRFNHDFIGTEHILLGLIGEGRGVAAHVLKNLGVEIDQIRREIEKNVQSGPPVVTMGQLPFTPRAKKVLELSMEEANELGHNYLGTEHLLLGLLRENDGVAARVLLDLGLKLEEVRNEVLDLLGAESGNARRVAALPGIESELMARAGEEALRAGHGFVGTGHLLLALLADDGGNAEGILEDLGAGAERVRGEKEKLARYELDALPGKRLVFSPLLTGVLQRARRLARFLGQESFDSRHLLLALVAEGDSYVARILVQLGLDVEEARRRACAALDIDPEKARRVLLGTETPEAIGGLIRRLLRRLNPPGERD
jgi:ATP-dependent Clp protease ATP-binding subunit ClpA